MLIGGAPYLYSKNGSSTILEMCVAFNRFDIINVILKRHQEEKTEKGDKIFRVHIAKALLIAAKTNFGYLARKFLDAGTNLGDIDLHKIVEYGGWEVLSEVMSFYSELSVESIDSPKNRNTMLHTAAKYGKTHTIKFLLQRGADPNALNVNNRTPLHLACKFTDNEIALSILIENTNVTLLDKKGKGAVMFLARRGKENLFALLALRGANFDQRDSEGRLPLTVAAGKGHPGTVSALLLNGATFSVVDGANLSPLDHAIKHNRDKTASLIIRMDTNPNCVEAFFKERPDLIQKVIKNRLKETLIAMLDRSAIDEGLGSEKVYIRVKDWENLQLLDRLSKWGNKEISYHGTIRILVNTKMSKFGYILLILKLAWYIIFLMALSYSLIQASTLHIPRDNYIDTPLNILRLLTELFVLIYFIQNIVTEGVEVYRIMKERYSYLRGKQHLVSSEKSRLRKFTSKLNDIFIFRIFSEYYQHKSNIFDSLAIFTLFVLILLHVSNQPLQWVFATLTFFINAVRLFRLIILIPKIGPYSTIIFEILVKDVPLFLSLFLITLLIFTTGYFISLRTPYTPEGFRNASLMQDILRIPGVDNGIQWVFLTGLRVLLEGNIYDDVYLYQHLNWLSASIYVIFLFLTVVVYLNVFIAQLSDRYAEVKQRANQIHSQELLSFIVQMETTSVLSLCYGFEKNSSNTIEIGRREMQKYYQVSRASTLNSIKLNQFINTKLSPYSHTHRYRSQIHKSGAEKLEENSEMRLEDEEDSRNLIISNNKALCEMKVRQSEMEHSIKKLSQILDDRTNAILHLLENTNISLHTTKQEL